MSKFEKYLNEVSVVNGRERKDDELVWKQTGLSASDAKKKFGAKNVKITKGGLNNGDDMIEVLVPLKRS